MRCDAKAEVASGVWMLQAHGSPERSRREAISPRAIRTR